MKWIAPNEYDVMEDSSSFGNYINNSWETSAMSLDNGATWESGTSEVDKGALFKTGAAETVRNNIYDIAGNLFEWTNESSSEQRVIRGGHFNYTSTYYSAAYRLVTNKSGTSNTRGFRVVLYLN
jgi:formylglycine-generating enzyme required for sulfatase activity